VEDKPMMNETYVAEQATGCVGSGDYRSWAAKQGFDRLEVVDWTSSAGDWTFMVSRDGECWFPMYQENRWPRPGFDRKIDESEGYYGTFEEACAEFCGRYS